MENAERDELRRLIDERVRIANEKPPRAKLSKSREIQFTAVLNEGVDLKEATRLARDASTALSLKEGVASVRLVVIR